MSGSDFGYLFYLVLLGTFIAGYFIWDRRQSFSQTLQQALIWVFIFALAIIAYGFRDVLTGELFPRQARQMDAETIVLSRAEGGSFIAEVEVNGQVLPFLVDTGASQVVLSQSAARQVGLDPGGLSYTGRAVTANGVVETAPVMLDEIRFGDFTDRQVPAAVNSGDLDISLLGMTYLDRFDRIEIRGNEMLLVRR